MNRLSRLIIELAAIGACVVVLLNLIPRLMVMVP